MTMTPEQKEKMRLGREKAKEAKLDTDDGLAEKFDKAMATQARTNELILTTLETLVNKDKVVGQVLEEEKEEVLVVPVEEEIQHLSGKQLAMFERYFDTNDGFSAWYNVNKNIFTIEVPASFSNVTDAHKALYKQDLRSIKVDSNNVLGSIENWCKRVCINLGYNRKINLK